MLLKQEEHDKNCKNQINTSKRSRKLIKCLRICINRNVDNLINSYSELLPNEDKNPVGRPKQTT